MPRIKKSVASIFYVFLSQFCRKFRYFTENLIFCIIFLLFLYLDLNEIIKIVFLTGSVDCEIVTCTYDRKFVEICKLCVKAQVNSKNNLLSIEPGKSDKPIKKRFELNRITNKKVMHF